nr:iron-containing alcohol dehydrogenase [Maliibacterium massiliense]
MQDFVFHVPTKFIFGRNTEGQAGAEIRAFGGKTVLLHYGGGSIKKSGLYERVVASLKEAGLSFVELAGVKPNPRLSLVREGIDLCRRAQVDFILAVGGGSVIDSAKAIAMGVPYEGDVWDFFTTGKKPARALKLGVVLTIPAAGSESSAGCVITNEDGWYKLAGGGPATRSSFSILNPELTYTLPAYQTAAGIVDMYAHIVERYFSNTQGTFVIDRMAEGVWKTLLWAGPKVLKEPENYDYRAEIMWAGTVAHNDTVGVGRESDWASHNIEHELSGIYDITHGAGLAVIIPAWMRYVYKHDVPRFVRYAVNVYGVENDANDPEKTALEGIARTEQFFHSLGMPIRLSEMGIGEDRFMEMANKAYRYPHGYVGNFVKLSVQDVYNIYQLAR